MIIKTKNVQPRWEKMLVSTFVEKKKIIYIYTHTHIWPENDIQQLVFSGIFNFFILYKTSPNHGMIHFLLHHIRLSNQDSIELLL